MHQLLLKFLENSCNEQELDEVLAYLQTERGQKQLAELIDSDLLNSSHQSITEGVATTDYDQIYNQIKHSLTTAPPNGASVPPLLGRRWLRAAAVLAGIIALVLTWLLIQEEGFSEYQTAYGETRPIALPDGSVAFLNANSYLAVHSDFDRQREVWLEGEAFFTIKKLRNDGSKDYSKFILHLGEHTVEVLGTSFNAQRRKERAQVVLKTGRVKLISSTQEEVIMKPGELAEVSGKSTAISRKSVNPDIYSSWTENKLLCDDTPLADIAVVIEQRYGKEVVFQDLVLKNVTVTGTLPLHSLPLLSEVLAESLDIHIQSYDNRLVISQSKRSEIRNIN